MRFFRRSACPTCAAKDVTITFLADQIDWHRNQIGISHQSASDVVKPRPMFKPGENPEPMWVSDEEEEITSALNGGHLSVEAAEQALAQLQAMNQTVSVA